MPAPLFGGTTFFVTGLEKPLAFIGDAVFAGSMSCASERSWPQAHASLAHRNFHPPPDG